MTKHYKFKGAKMLILLAVASMFIVACSKKDTVKPTAAQAAASAAAAQAAAQTTLITGKWEDGKEEQIVYDSTKKVVADTVFDTGNNFRYAQYTSDSTYYNVATQFAVDTQATYHYKIANNAVTYTDLTDAGYTMANLVQLTAQDLEIEYIFTTSGASSVQVQMFNLDPTMTYTVNYFRYYTRIN